MRDLSEKMCLTEAIAASNSNQVNANSDGLEIAADRALQEVFGQADIPLGSAAPTQIACERCEAVFFVRESEPGERGVLMFGWKGEEGKECDQPSLAPTASALGEWVMNVNLRNVA